MGVHGSALWAELVLDLLHLLLPHWALVGKGAGLGVVVLLEMVLAHALLVDARGEGVGDHVVAVCHGGRRRPRWEWCERAGQTCLPPLG
jgi:hypothetical protein